jgi:GT2 family glycosyltransferase
MIPKIIHQLWIGSLPAPSKFMNTWRDKNPSFQYMLWNETEISKQPTIFACQNRVNEIEEINGKADILRWEILYAYGGVFLDADSICIEPIDDILMNTTCFAGWEQEQVRTGLIATGTMGFPPKHPLVKQAIDWIKANPVSFKKTGKRAWLTVGPMLLTNMYNSNEQFKKDMTIFPSYFFLPIHGTGLEYKGHGKIYAYQAWGSSKQNYEQMNNMSLPPQFDTPPVTKAVSILVSSYNTKAVYIKECLESIKHQQGHFNIELVWINDGSNPLNTNLLKQLLEQFQKTARFITVVYSENDGNKGIGYTLNKGIEMCSNDLIIKMDSDDIMLENRIQKQMTYMQENPATMICGGQISCFNSAKQIVSQSNHPSLTWEHYKSSRSHWFINHPTVCYRKSAVLNAGNYNANLKQMAEDFELELRMLKTHGYIHNMPEVLLNYRLHDEQVTYNGGKEGRSYWNTIRNDIINGLLK